MIAVVDNIAGLADAINALRIELAEAQKAGSGDGIRFRVSGVELTMNAVLVKGASGGVGWGVLGLGAKVESAITQTLTLQLQPVLDTPAGEIELRVTDSDHSAPQFGPQ